MLLHLVTCNANMSYIITGLSTATDNFQEKILAVEILLGVKLSDIENQITITAT